MTLQELETILSTSIRRDSAPNKITFLGMLLSQTENSQINIGYQGESSAGKSWIAIESSNYFPKSVAMILADASPNSFFHDSDAEWIEESHS